MFDKITEPVGNSNRLTDSEIIKALECCVKPRGKRECEKCHYFFSDIKCKTHLLIDVLDLINRQKEEIESLKAECQAADGYEDALVERTKAKAYKEVFEKLNDKALVRKIKLYGNWFIVKGVTLHDINTLKKEMVGE